MFIQDKPKGYSLGFEQQDSTKNKKMNSKLSGVRHEKKQLVMQPQIA